MITPDPNNDEYESALPQETPEVQMVRLLKEWLTEWENNCGIFCKTPEKLRVYTATKEFLEDA